MTALRSISNQVVLAAIVLLLAAAPRARAGPPSALPESWAGDADCKTCHSDQGAALPMHEALLGANRGPALHCETCHGPGAEHVQDPGVHPMQNPDAWAPADANRACLGCHSLPVEVDAIQHQHQRAALRCTECHAIHGAGEQRALLRKAPTQTCLGCHSSVAADLHATSHHPVEDGRLTCATCHAPAPEATPVRAPQGVNTLCVSCHAEIDPLTPYAHAAGSEVAIEGQGCTVCHAPHGSPHPRLLRRPGDALCLECHLAPPGHRNAHDGIYAGTPCLECHAQVHGSYTNRALLAPHPLGQDCLTCHGR